MVVIHAWIYLQAYVADGLASASCPLIRSIDLSGRMSYSCITEYYPQLPKPIFFVGHLSCLCRAL